MVTQERFWKGYTWEEYLQQITQNVDHFRQKYDEVVITEEEEAFYRQFPKKVFVLALAEDWCPDVYNNLPVMARLAALTDQIVLRIFPRDRNHDLMHRYLFRGQ
ncbi:MAG: thioredoxin family protein, partial [Nitrospinota bacterium]